METIEYKGCTIKIKQDDCCESPSDFGDTGLFLVGYHQREFWVEAPKQYYKLPEGSKRLHQDKGHPLFTKEELIAYFENDPEGYSFPFKDYHVFPLEAYIHSGVVLHLSGGCAVDRQWDVSQVGAVLVSKKETRYKAKAYKLAEGLITTWNDYLSGNVYGFIAQDEQGNELDSCWGFYGNPEKSGCIEQGKEAIDHYLKTKQEVLHDLVTMS